MAKNYKASPLPKVGIRIHETGPNGRSGEVIAVLEDRGHPVFVARFWVPWKRRFAYECFTGAPWEFGLIRAGRKGKK